MRFTHTGWLAACPVKLADVESNTPTIVPRWWPLAPWWWINVWFCNMTIRVCSALMQGYYPYYTVRNVRRIE